MQKTINRTHARVRSGVPTGTTKHFTFWKQDLKLKSFLQKTKTLALANAQGQEPQTAAAYLLCHKSGLRTLFAIIDASPDRMKTVTGLGPVRLRLLGTDLTKRGIQAKWMDA